MTKLRSHRLAEVEQRIRSIPIPAAVVRAAFEPFRKTGELPDDMRLAYAVVCRAKRGAARSDLHERESDWGELIRASMAIPERPEDPLMDELYDEAVFATGPVREAARQVLRAFAAAGLDPSEPRFVGRKRQIPDYGSVGLHMLGIPQRMVRPPYEAQARRLFARAERLREIIPQGDRRWFEMLEATMHRFQSGAEIPEDPLVLDCILVMAEVQSLLRHASGEDVTELMGALGVAATTTGEERRAAIARVQEVLASGSITRQSTPSRGVLPDSRPEHR